MIIYQYLSYLYMHARVCQCSSIPWSIPDTSPRICHREGHECSIAGLCAMPETDYEFMSTSICRARALPPWAGTAYPCTMEEQCSSSRSHIVTFSVTWFVTCVFYNTTCLEYAHDAERDSREPCHHVSFFAAAERIRIAGVATWRLWLWVIFRISRISRILKY